MRRLTLLAGVLVLTACPPQSLPNPPPVTQFYFPTGVVHVDPCAGLAPDAGCFNEEGYLYVASANFDKRYDTGAITAVNLGQIGLPPFDTAVVGGEGIHGAHREGDAFSGRHQRFGGASLDVELTQLAAGGIGQ